MDVDEEMGLEAKGLRRMEVEVSSEGINSYPEMDGDEEMGLDDGTNEYWTGMERSLENSFPYHIFVGLPYGSIVLEGNTGTNIITPKLVAIGPFHRAIRNSHGTFTIQEMEDGDALEEMECAKFRYLYDLFRRAPSNHIRNYARTIRSCWRTAIKEWEKQGKRATLSQIEHGDFLKLMIVDGCFIVEFLLKWFLNDRKSQASSIMTELAVFKNDLLLVGNQIPYFILEKLFKRSSVPGLDESVSFTEIALAFLVRDRKVAQFTAEKFSVKEVQFDHLLHLYHATLCSYSDRNYLCKVNKLGWFVVYPIVLLWSLIVIIIKGLLFLPFWILTRLFIRRRKPRWIPSGIPNARDLRDAGFIFDKKDGMDCNIMDISRHGRNIKIPVLHVNESLLTNFRSLIAFENSYSNSNKYGKNFTAYAMLLDYLIDSIDDVAILKACGIIDNRLGDDQKVADFFNNLCCGSDLGDEKHYLSPLFEYVTSYYRESHYKVKFYWLIKKYVPDYFTNPWAITSMIAGLILLALTFLQTFYTIYPYYNPRSNG